MRMRRLLDELAAADKDLEAARDAWLAVSDGGRWDFRAARPGEVYRLHRAYQAAVAWRAGLAAKVRETADDMERDSWREWE